MRTAITIAVLLAGGAVLAGTQKTGTGAVRGVAYENKPVYEIRCDRMSTVENGKSVTVNLDCFLDDKGVLHMTPDPMSGK